MTKMPSLQGTPWGYLDRSRPRRIVFYGRVSTEHEAQLSALENQIQWYDDQLRCHPNWMLVERYIDEGITGTQAKKRPAFLRMLEDARAGKFDLIVTREVCRFARNTVDTLVTTRELKNIGVEVYFVEDNIWTMDGDGELRLTIMATLAQEESRKVSERVKAGQYVSREKGTLYGSGNILGYDRVGDTYVINEDQAETVRMIFDMYLNESLGTGKIAQRLTELGRLNASGLNKWSHGVISRILNNQTYMGIMAYGKSFSNNYLEQKRINNRDKSTYIYREGKFPAIVSQEDWHRAQEIKASRMMERFSPRTGKKVRHCVQENKDLWGSKLRCTCGCGFRKNVWHRYKDRPTSYGYQCYNILNNGSAKQRREAGADDTGYCDQPMIADWKLELMGKAILEQVFREQRDLIQYTIGLIRQSCRTARSAETSRAVITAQMERVKAKKETLLDMRTEGEITKEEFLAQRKKLDAELHRLTAEQERLTQSNTIDLDQPEWSRIQDALEEILDLSQPKPSPDLIRRFVTRVVPNGKSDFSWYLNLDGRGTTAVDMTVEGRKNHAILTFSGEQYAPQEESGIIDLKNACLCPTPPRQGAKEHGSDMPLVLRYGLGDVFIAADRQAHDTLFTGQGMGAVSCISSDPSIQPAIPRWASHCQDPSIPETGNASPSLIFVPQRTQTLPAAGKSDCCSGGVTGAWISTGSTTGAETLSGSSFPHLVQNREFAGIGSLQTGIESNHGCACLRIRVVKIYAYNIILQNTIISRRNRKYSRR